MYDFSDGQIYKSHPVFSTDKYALQIILYYDDVETANPLGSYRGRHKLGMYFLVICTNRTYIASFITFLATYNQSCGQHLSILNSWHVSPHQILKNTGLTWY